MKTAKKVLVIDDDLGILEVIRIILEEKGFVVIPLSAVGQIKQMIQQNKPDVMLVDLWMSGMDGHQIIKMLKGDPKYKDLPIISISALNEGEKIAKEAGADDFLAKPFNIDDLVAVIEKNLQ